VIDRLLERLEKEKFSGRLNRLFGLSLSRAQAEDPEMAKVAFDRSDKKEPNRVGWTLPALDWIKAHPETIQKVLNDAQVIRAQYKFVIFCGMGGSGLSVQLVKTTFGEKDTRIYSLRTTDPRAIKNILDEITRIEGSLKAALEVVLVIAISKSGKTQETVSHKRYFEDLLMSQSIEAREHIWVITDKGSPMDTGDYTQREIQLNGKGDVGGRFTAPTTNIFLLPLAIAAPERLQVILDKAGELNSIEAEKDIYLQLSAFIYGMAAERGKNKLTVFMAPELRDVPLWAEQLSEESSGKDGKGFSLFYGEDLTKDNLRPAEQDDRVFLRINLGEKKANPELWGHLEANGYPAFEINLDDLNSIGGLMLGLQRSIMAIGYLWGICPVDQPAVEGYKKATRVLWDEYQKTKKAIEVPAGWKHARYNSIRVYYQPLLDAGVLTEAQIQTQAAALGRGTDDAAGVYAGIIMLLKDKFESGEIISYGEMTPDLSDQLQKILRTGLFTGPLRKPAKLGTGPDKNHSFHQLIEDGPDMWLSTYFMANQLAQPEALAFDPNLLKAQTIGTVKSLSDKGRKVLLVTFDKTIEDSWEDTEVFLNDVVGLFIKNS